MTHHRQSATTHTVELDQVQEINRRLGSPRHRVVTATTLHMAGQPVGSPTPTALSLFGVAATPATLDPDAVLLRITAEGSPEFPYVIGHFRDTAHGVRDLVVELHSAALHELCLRMGLHQCWGTDAVLIGSSIR